MQVPHVVPEVTIPPEVTPENVTTSIVDTSCTFSTRVGLHKLKSSKSQVPVSSSLATHTRTCHLLGVQHIRAELF